MGLLVKTLSEQSSYAAKKNGLWETLMERLEECVVPGDVDDFERNLAGMDLEIPAAWRESLAEVIEKKREEIEEEDLTLIMRRRFDFS